MYTCSEIDLENYDEIYNDDGKNETNFQEKELRGYLPRINIDKYEAPNLKGDAVNCLLEKIKKDELNRFRLKEKSDHATIQQVLDSQTRVILCKLIKNEIIVEINGCVSTGKEANVYHATSPDPGMDYAIKIFKSSILKFKDRSKYVTGEFRFRRGYSGNNPRKMVQTWAEKEFRNLLRIYNTGIKVPKPIQLKNRLIVIEFIGINGWPAPKLKDVILSEAEATELYKKCITIMWQLFNTCKLVHADLSEYNILYLNGELVIIDVSQSVEHDHPRASQFLRKDCTNITEFFKKYWVATMSVENLYNFVTYSTLTSLNLNDYVDDLCRNVAETLHLNANQDDNDDLFNQMYIPTRLSEVVDAERDIFDLGDDVDRNDLVYKTLISVAKKQDDGDEDEDEDKEDDSDDDDTSNGDNHNDSKPTKVTSSRPKEETTEEKRARKKAFKEEKAERRKTKVKKHIKKKLTGKK